MTKRNHKLLKINLLPRNFSKLEELQYYLEAKNLTDTVKRLLEITDIISNTIKHGGKVILEESSGRRYNLILPGVL